MNNLVIGNTSQISHYFPENYIKISSRNIDFNFLKSQNWLSVYLCFGESKKFSSEKYLHNEVNYELTLKLIDLLVENSKKIVLFSTCELWNKYTGQITLDTPFNFYETKYINSKFKITNKILKNKKKYKNVIIVYPFNFNSIYRSNDFLFGKIFDSIINKKRIEIGDTYFYRDIIHPKFLVKKSIETEKDIIVGSGRLTFINDFIRDLYKHYSMCYDDYVVEKLSNFLEYEKRNEYYLNNKKCEFTYNNLLNFTISDINTKLNQ